MHWFYDPNFTDTSRFITKSETEHFKSLRIRPNEEITITNGLGAFFLCKVLDPKSGAIEMVLSNHQEPPKVSIHLVQALAKGDRDEQAVQACVELGLKTITPWQSELSVSNWTGKESRGRQRWQEIVVSAMKQSQQANLPQVKDVRASFQLEPIGFGIVLDPRASLAITEVPKDIRELTIVVGPEGGITSGELDLLHSRGFRSYRLGPSVLRTSTAGPAAVASIFTSLSSW
jgi:16S rRNA (uracil1498-N3)-methyltransferase